MEKQSNVLLAMSDEELVNQVKLNRSDALSQLTERYYPRRFYYYSRNHPVLWRKIGESECNACFFSTLLDCVALYQVGQVSFSAYFQAALRYNLLRVARESHYLDGLAPLSLDHYEGDEAEGSCLADVIPSSTSDDPRIQYDQSEWVDDLNARIATLPELVQQVGLYREEGKTYQEIANLLHCSIKKVRVAYANYKKAVEKFYRLKNQRLS
jgi:DNA-directed RNA polymerase specialized sigma24 family protein